MIPSCCAHRAPRAIVLTICTNLETHHMDNRHRTEPAGWSAGLMSIMRYSILRSFDHSIFWSVDNWSVDFDHSIIQSFNHSIIGSLDHWIFPLVEHPIIRLLHHLIVQALDHSIEIDLITCGSLSLSISSWSTRDWPLEEDTAGPPSIAAFY